MVGIEIAVLSLGEVKLIHIKNHESMLATVKNVDGKGYWRRASVF